MNKKIEWIKRGMTANNGLHMQEVCDQIADATTAINNSLQKPEIAPGNTQLIAVDNTNTQTMLNIGDGLRVENGSLKASAGGTGSKLYYKTIRLEFLTENEGLPGIDYINIYFYESNDTIYDINNINTLYEKIPFAICNFTGPASIWILGCLPTPADFNFYCLQEGGNVTHHVVSFSQIDDTNITMDCNYIEV